MHRAGPAAWRQAAPMPVVQPTLATFDSDFAGSLATRTDPSFLAPLGHYVLHDAPAGVVDGLARPAARTFDPSPPRLVSRMAYGDDGSAAVPAAEALEVEPEPAPVARDLIGSAVDPVAPRRPDEPTRPPERAPTTTTYSGEVAPTHTERGPSTAAPATAVPAAIPPLAIPPVVARTAIDAEPAPEVHDAGEHEPPPTPVLETSPTGGAPHVTAPLVADAARALPLVSRLDVHAPSETAPTAPPRPLVSSASPSATPATTTAGAEPTPTPTTRESGNDGPARAVPLPSRPVQLTRAVPVDLPAMPVRTVPMPAAMAPRAVETELVAEEAPTLGTEVEPVSGLADERPTDTAEHRPTVPATPVTTSREPAGPATTPAASVQRQDAEEPPTERELIGRTPTIAPDPVPVDPIRVRDAGQTFTTYSDEPAASPSVPPVSVARSSAPPVSLARSSAPPVSVARSTLPSAPPSRPLPRIGPPVEAHAVPHAPLQRELVGLAPTVDPVADRVMGAGTRAPDGGQTPTTYSGEAAATAVASKPITVARSVTMPTAVSRLVQAAATGRVERQPDTVQWWPPVDMTAAAPSVGASQPSLPVQRADDPAASTPPPMSAGAGEPPTTTEPAALSGGVVINDEPTPRQPTDAEVEQLARALYPQLRRRLGRDLLLDRERLGYRTDIRF